MYGAVVRERHGEGRPIRPLTFRQRQIIALLTLAITPLAVLDGIALPIAERIVVEQARATLEIGADMKSQQVREWLDQGRNLVTLVTNLREVHEALPDILAANNSEKVRESRQNLKTEISSISNTFPSVMSVSVLHPESGRVVVSTEPAFQGRIRASEPYFIKGREALFVSSVHYSLGREAPLITVSAPVTGGKDDRLAVIEVQLNLADLQATLNNETGPGEISRSYIIDSRGLYLTSPSRVSAAPLQVKANSEGVRRVLAGESGFARYDDPSGEPVAGVYRWLGDESIGLLVEIDQSAITGRIRTVWLVIAIATFGLAVLVIPIARRLATWLGQPLAEIADTAEALRGGDLSRRVPERVQDEIGQLATAFNEMAEELERSYNTLGSLLEESTTGQQRAEAKLASVVDTATDAIISADGNARVIMFNQAAERMLGCTAAEAFGIPVGAFVPETSCQPAPVSGGMAAGFRLHEPETVHDTIAHRRDGSSFPAEISVSYAEVMNDTILTVILRDITERKKAAAELAQLNEDLERRVDERTSELQDTQLELLKRERLATLGQLTATVSHEIRNPLGAMRTTLYTLETRLEGSPPVIQKSIERLKRSVKRCDDIIDELLDFSRVRQPEPEPTPLDEWLADVLDEQEVPENVSLRFEPGLGDRQVAVDRERLRRAVINVVENGAQAIESNGGAGQVTVSTVAQGGKVEIRIADNGPGISEEEARRIFEPLFSTKTFGVGLGLAITRQIVEQHGGVVLVESDPAGGETCFIFRLPVHAEEAVEA